MKLSDISTSSESSKEVVLKKEYYQEQDKYYEGLRADPDNPIKTTKDIAEARKWEHLSDARSFCNDNMLDQHGFEARIINRNT